jgi:hypothetical protein
VEESKMLLRVLEEDPTAISVRQLGQRIPKITKLGTVQ